MEEPEVSANENDNQLPGMWARWVREMVSKIRHINGNLLVRLGDAVGGTKFSLRDAVGVEVAYIDSDGRLVAGANAYNGVPGGGQFADVAIGAIDRDREGLSWGYPDQLNLLLSGNTWTTIGFHDSGASVGILKYGNSKFYISSPHVPDLRLDVTGGVDSKRRMFRHAQASYGTAQWLKIATLPASAANTGDMLTLNVFGGGYNSNSKFYAVYVMGARGGFTATSRMFAGDWNSQYFSRIQVYQQGNGTFDVYLHPTGGDWSHVAVEATTGEWGIADQVVLATSAVAQNSTPAGTLVWDSYTATATGAQHGMQGWIAPAFQNGWNNYGGQFETAGYFKDPSGFVHLRGLVQGGTVSAAIFTLPAGYRPAQERICTVANGTSGYGELRITVGGAVNHIVGGNGWFSLAVPPFRAES
jgi:hypothetical protein